MACSTTLAGLAKDCNNNRGGIKNIYIGLSGALTVTLTSGKITALALATGAAKFKRYAFSPKSAQLDSTAQYNEAGEFAGVQSILGVRWGAMNSTKRTEMVAHSQGDLAIVVEDANGVLWYLGYDYPVRMTAGSGATGAKAEDNNGYSASYTDESLAFPYEIDSAAWTSALWE